MKRVIVLLLAGFMLALTSTAQISVQKVYTSQVGVRELTGHNDGKMVAAYLQTVKLSQGYPWCAAFVKWSYLQAGITTSINGMALSVHRPGHLIYFHGNFLQEPEPGDAFTLYFPSLKRIGHTGFLMPGSTVQCLKPLKEIPIKREAGKGMAFIANTEVLKQHILSRDGPINYI